MVNRSRSDIDERVRIISITKEGMALKLKAKDILVKLAASLTLTIDCRTSIT